MRRSREGALEQNERKPKNGSRVPPSQPILMRYTLKDRKCFNYWFQIYVYHDLSEVIRGQIWSRLKLILETGDKFNMISKMHSQSGITNVADVHNLAKFNSRIMAAFLPEYENFHRNMKTEL